MMIEYTWENIVAYMTWKCRICGDTMDRDDVGGHLYDKHKLRTVAFGCDSRAYSPDYPSKDDKEG